MVYSTITVENDITALDTQTGLTERGADSPLVITVPDATKITEIRIAVAADWTADTLLGFSSGLKLTGACGEQWLAGPVGTTGGAATTSAGLKIAKPTQYLCNIPVQKGGEIHAYGFMHGEDVGSIRMSVTIVFDGPVQGVCNRYDYREQDLAAANTPVTLNTRGGATENDFKVGGNETICEVRVGAGVKPVAGPLGATTLFVLSSTGLATSNGQEFQGNTITTQDDITASGATNIEDPVLYQTAIPTKKGQIRCQAQEVEDDVGTPYAICCLGFR